MAGRTDDQVKIRGFRVELGEVRAAILGHQDVKDGFVLSRTRDGERWLHAFAVPAHPSARATDVLAQLRASLPRYAVPAHLTLLPELPLTANGKVDRAALAADVARSRRSGGPGSGQPNRADYRGRVAGRARPATDQRDRQLLRDRRALARHGSSTDPARAAARRASNDRGPVPLPQHPGPGRLPGRAGARLGTGPRRPPDRDAQGTGSQTEGGPQ